MTWNVNSQAATSASFFSYFCPARFKPSQAYIHSFIRCLNNSTSTIGFLIYDSGSTLFQIYSSVAQANFIALGNCGFSETSSAT